MKKYVRANRYADETDKNLKQIGFLSRNLSDVIDATDTEELEAISRQLGKLYEGHSTDKAFLIEAILQNMEWHMKEYREQQSKSNKYPEVESSVLDAAYDFGFDVESTDHGFYRLSEDADMKTMNDFCKYLRDNLGVRWETGLYGSWTRHSGSLNGIRVHVGFEYDPETGGRTLQLEF